MEDRPVTAASWTSVEIAGKVDDDSERIGIGCLLKGVGQMWVDEVQLLKKNPDGQWESIPIHNPGFEETDPKTKPLGWDLPDSGYAFQTTESSPYKGKRSLTIRSTHVFGNFMPLEWSADGKYIYAFDTRAGKQIVRIGADGEEVKLWIELSLAEGSSVASAAITPDGQRAIYSSQQSQSDVWVVENFDSR